MPMSSCHWRNRSIQSSKVAILATSCPPETILYTQTVPSLDPFEPRHRLLRVCRQTFRGVAAVDQPLLQLALHRQPFGQRDLHAGAHGPLDMPHCFTGLVWGHELLGIGESLRPELITVKHIID